jgi:uncharacterized protein (DUF983 family)
MYCYHCGYDINENAIEAKSSTRQKYIEQAPLDADVQYVCPRCGHLIHHGMEQKDVKSLSVACHAELQRGRNDFARGMSAVSIAIILAIVSFIFLQLSKKVDNQFRVTTTCPEFWICLVLGVIAVILIVFGAILVARGLIRKHKYTGLLKDINTKTFVQ